MGGTAAFSVDHQVGPPHAIDRDLLSQDDSIAAASRIDLGPAIAGALAAVPEPFRSAVVIVDVQDQSYVAAAEALGVPIGTVRSRLFRGRRIMQQRLAAYGRDAILAAYEARPPDETLQVLDVADDPAEPGTDVVRFRWASGARGTMRLRWRGELVAELEVRFD